MLTFRIHPLPAALVAIAALACACAAPRSDAQIGRQAGSESAIPVTHSSTQAPPPQTKPQQKPQLLPAAFASLPREGDIVDIQSAAGADAAHAAVLQEDGFAGASQATYRGDEKNAWRVQVFRFEDATGAYSAFTFYRSPAMQRETVGDNAAAGRDLFLMRAGTNLVMVRPTTQTGASASTLSTAMKGLLGILPHVGGSEEIPPSLPTLLPVAQLDRQTLHYAIGPAGYNGPIPASTIDFRRDVEAMTAAYHLTSGRSASLTLLMAPTPQIAAAQAHAIAALPDSSLHVGVRRLGPLVGVVSGAGISPAEAGALLGEVHYKADVTIDQPGGYTSEVAKTAKLLIGIAELTGVIAFAAVFVGISFGAGRVFVRRLQGKPDSSVFDEEFISLKL